jgi:hypothetical protein
MEFYGEVLGEVEEELEKLDDVEDETDSEDDSLLNLGEDFKFALPEAGGTGTFKVKVKFNIRPPQYLPAFGQKSRIHYQGIEKICTNCYETGHIKKSCTNPKKPWIKYVKSFMEMNNNIPSEMYGRWDEVVKNEFGGKSQSQDQQKTHPSHEQQLMEVTQAMKSIKDAEMKEKDKLAEARAESTTGNDYIPQDKEQTQDDGMSSSQTLDDELSLNPSHVSRSQNGKTNSKTRSNSTGTYKSSTENQDVFPARGRGRGKIKKK